MPPSTTRDYSALYIPGAIVIAGVIIGVSLVIALKPSAGGGTQTIDVNIEDVDLEGDPFIGDEDAPVVLAYWSDYQCPFCKAVETGGVPQIPIEPAIPELIEQYVNTGKLRIVFNDYAFLGPDSTIAALYGRAVWETYPSRYYEWREAMYKAQDEEHGGFGNEESILELTAGIEGFDADALKALVAQKGTQYQELIDADQQEGASFGITGTPGFITGETLIPGAVEFAQFKAAIDAQL